MPPGPFEERDGDLYVSGTDVPVADLERTRRAGSSEADLCAAVPGLPVGIFDAVDALLRDHPGLDEAWAERLAPTRVEPGDEDDRGEGFEAELEEIIDAHAELFRRLAR